jgi:cytosine/uracil/thiamine/allantoin permease
VPLLRVLYNYAWFVGFAVSFFVYLTLMKVNQTQAVAQAAD